MYKLAFTTTNPGKVETLNRNFKPYNIQVVHLNIEIPEIQATTVREVATRKVLDAYSIIKEPCIAVDGGLFIPSLNDYPGVFTKHVMETIGIEGVLKLVDGKPRDCRCEDCLAYYDGTLADPIIFETDNYVGTLAQEPRENLGARRNWSNVQRIFIPRGYKKAEAEMTEDEYRKYKAKTHEHSFSAKFAKWFLDNQ